jgi:hypothetical protein
MTTGVKPVLSVFSTAEELQSGSWPFGTVVQEFHTGDCCNVFHFCDVYAPIWEMASRVVGHVWAISTIPKTSRECRSNCCSSQTGQSNLARYLTAARPASSRATGSRNGEQDT